MLTQFLYIHFLGAAVAIGLYAIATALHRRKFKNSTTGKYYKSIIQAAHRKGLIVDIYGSAIYSQRLRKSIPIKSPCPGKHIPYELVFEALIFGWLKTIMVLTTLWKVLIVNIDKRLCHSGADHLHLRMKEKHLLKSDCPLDFVEDKVTFVATDGMPDSITKAQNRSFIKDHFSHMEKGSSVTLILTS